MTKSLISYIADGATVAILSFIAVFTVAKFYLSGTFPSLVVALCVAAAATSAYILVSEKRRGAQLLGRKDAILLERFTLSLLLAEKTVATERIFGYIRKKNYALSPDKNGFFTDDNSFAVCVFKAEPLTADDLLQAVRMTPKDKDLLIIGVGFSDNAKDFAAKFCDLNIVLTPLSSLFPAFKSEIDETALPKIKGKRSGKFADMLKATFDKRRAKTFALYGAALLIMSNFVFYPLWYILSGCLFLIYAVTLKFFASDRQNAF